MNDAKAGPTWKSCTKISNEGSRVRTPYNAGSDFSGNDFASVDASISPNLASVQQC